MTWQNVQKNVKNGFSERGARKLVGPCIGKHSEHSYIRPCML